MSPRSLHPELEEIDEALAQLPLAEPHKSALRTRYVGYGQWLETGSKRTRIGHYVLRLLAAVSGVVAAALAGVNVERPEARWGIFALALVVATCLTIDSLFNLEERWLHYRTASEELKSRLWSFVQLGDSSAAGGLENARVRFVEDTERFFREEVGTYVKGPARERAAKRDAEGA
jgi:hypothetical protein